MAVMGALGWARPIFVEVYLDFTTFAIRFGIAVLAVWRVTHLLSSEDGPFDLFVRLRAALAGTQPGRMIDCPYCLSMWIALPGALFLRIPPLETAAAWLALSGAVCLIERGERQPVVFQTTSDAVESPAAASLEEVPL